MGFVSVVTLAGFWLGAAGGAGVGDVTESAKSCLGIHQPPQYPHVPSFHMPRGQLSMRQEQESIRNSHSRGVGGLRAAIPDVVGIFGSFNLFYLTSHAWMDETLSWNSWRWGETRAFLQESKPNLDEPRSEMSSYKFSKPRASEYI